jgi:putative endonuclease
MRDENIYYVYMMQSPSRRAIYWQHKNHIREGFTDDYNCTRLVYWESIDDVHNAIGREKQLKRWRREKKQWLIAQKNPRWQDLAADWYPTETQGPSTAVEGPCVSLLGRLEKQRLHFDDARRATRIPGIAPFPIWPEALQNREVIILVKPDRPT